MTVKTVLFPGPAYQIKVLLQQLPRHGNSRVQNSARYFVTLIAMEIISIVDIAIMVANLYYNSFWSSDCACILVSFLIVYHLKLSSLV